MKIGIAGGCILREWRLDDARAFTKHANDRKIAINLGDIFRTLTASKTPKLPYWIAPIRFGLATWLSPKTVKP